MKKLFSLTLVLCLLVSVSFSQIKFSDEVRKFIDYDASIIVLTNALLIDAKGRQAKSNQTIVVSDGRIQWVGDDAKAVLPKGAQIIDVGGKAVMPGLVMLHEHMYISAHSLSPRYPHLKQLPFTFPRLYLAGGATTIRTAGSIEPYSDIRIKKDIDSGKMPGPSIELTAPYIEGKNAGFPQMNELNSPEEATTFVNYWADQGATSFKAYMGVDKPILKAAIDAAHKRHLKITGHLCAVTYREAAALGMDTLEHGFEASTDFVSGKKENVCPPAGEAPRSLAELDVTSESVKSLLQFLIDKKVGIDSTLAVFEGFNTMQPQPSDDLLSMFSPDTRDFYLKLFARIKSTKSPSDSDRGFANTTKMEKMFYDMGGLLTVGTDPTGNGGTIASIGTWRAIELLVEADGFTPLEAIKIATLNGAIALGYEKNVGTIEPGKSADLLIIDGDPSKDIHDIRKVQTVFRNGIGYNSKKLFDSVRGKVGFN